MADNDQQNITNNAPNQGAQGVFHGPVHTGSQYNVAGDLRYDRRERRRLLKQVRENWIVGVLDKSLYQEALILLEMETDPEAVDPPCINYTGLKLGAKHKNTARTFPPETTVVQVFDESDVTVQPPTSVGAG